jgi:N-acetylmuramoyl-L-alanine amidase
MYPERGQLCLLVSNLSRLEGRTREGEIVRDSNEKGSQEPNALGMSILPAASPNFWSGRNGHKIVAIVDHITAGLMPGCLSWLCDPASGVSAHYLVDREGNIYKLVNESDTAWGCGVVDQPTWPLYAGINPNYIVLNIEHEGLPTDVEGDGDLTPAQYASSLWLHKQLIVAYGIPAKDPYIVGHHVIDANHADCPGGTFPFAQLFADLAPAPAPTPTMTYGSGSISGQILADGHLWVKAVEAAEMFGHDQYSWDAATETMTVD